MDKDTILKFKVPVVLMNRLKKWELMQYSLESWSNIFHNKRLEFRCGSKEGRESPYWEGQCEKKEMTFDEFLKTCKNENQTEKWFYFDYKYMTQLFQDTPDLLKKVRWSDLGFTELSGEDSTLWIGSAGAHTPCHFDTYGCNLVAQLFGRKLWLLLPPEESQNLKPTRVPYEESSVYSSVNFYTPKETLAGLNKVYKVILDPGDVLFVPRHWWHYVENLELSISINTWIPLEEDIESHVEEFLVRQFIFNICQTLQENSAKEFLNPNEYGLLEEGINNHLLERLLGKLKGHRENKKEIDKNVVELPFHSYYVPICSASDINSYIKSKHQTTVRLTSLRTDCNGKEVEQFTLTKNIINAFCNPQVITAVKNKLLEQ